MLYEIKLKDVLDKRICDIEKDTTNTQTYRDFIRETEKEFQLKSFNINLMKEDELRNYLDLMDELWSK